MACVACRRDFEWISVFTPGSVDAPAANAHNLGREVGLVAAECASSGEHALIVLLVVPVSGPFRCDSGMLWG